jgi:hypothetical protein
VWEEKAHSGFNQAGSLGGFWIVEAVMVAVCLRIGSGFGWVGRFCLFGVSSLFIGG